MMEGPTHFSLRHRDIKSKEFSCEYLRVLKGVIFEVDFECYGSFTTRKNAHTPTITVTPTPT